MECRDDQVDLLASTINLATWKLIARAFFGSFFFTWALKALATTVVTRCCPNKFYSRFSYSSSWGNWGRIQSPPQHSPPLKVSARHCWTTMLTTPALNGSTTPLPTTGTVTIALSSLITTIYHVSHICRYHPVTSDHQPHCHCQCLHLAPDLGLSNVYIYCQISSFLLMIQTRPWSGCGFQTFLSPLLFLFQIFIDNLQLFR